MLDIILFGMIAVFVGLRLYAVLGRRNGGERPPGPDPFAPAPPDVLGVDARADGNVTPFPTRPAAPQPVLAPPAPGAAQGPLVPGMPSAAPVPPKVLEGVRAARRIDPGFDPDAFIAGAGHAYEMIVAAFAVGDRATLKGLLDPAVYQSFLAAIDARENAHQTQESRFVTIKGAEILDIVLRGTTAEVTVRFASDMINVTRDAEGAVVAGHPAAAREVVDIWTFARDLKSRDPNWFLIATGGAA